MFLLLAVVLLVVLDKPWNFVGFAICLVLFCGEALYWNRTVRGRRAAVGVENLIGTEGRTLSPCRPAGQISLGGEIWEATCVVGVDEGRDVRVVGRNGLTLVVEPL